MTEKTIHKTIIIGSGPAGLTAAIYAARANLNPIVFEGNQPGGQLTITTDVENYPGEEYLTQSVSISTGASARLLGLDAENELMGYGVSTCATCDGYFFKDKEIIVVGGGDSAMEEANFLTKFASKVTIIHRREEFRASKIMIDRALNNPKIDVIKNVVVSDIFGSQKDGVNGVLLTNTVDGSETKFDCEGVFYGIGHIPNTKEFKDIIDLDDQGYIQTKDKSTATNIPGVFACGDVQDSYYRQAVTAAGSGCMAAIDVEKYLEDL